MAVSGDGCFLMSAIVLSTAAREGLPVNFVLGDRLYSYMQKLQIPVYRRTARSITRPRYNDFCGRSRCNSAQ